MGLTVQQVSNLLFFYKRRTGELEQKIEEKKKERESMELREVKLTKVNEFFQQQIEFRTVKTRQFIESIVNRGLGYIFQGQIRVEIQSEIKANKVYYDVVIFDDTSNVSGGRESHSGGVQAIVAFLFKFVANYLTKKMPVMVEDESLSDVSFHYQERLSNFLAEICEEFRYDLLLISHQPQLDQAANIRYELEKHGDETVISGVTEKED